MQSLRRALVVAVLLLLAACKVELFSGLTEREANDMLAILLRYDVPATKVVTKDGITLNVDVWEGYHGKPMELWFSEGLTTSILDSQVVVVGGPTLTKVTGLTLDANGRVSYSTTPGSLPPPLNTTRKPLFVQAIVFDGPFRFVTQPLVVWTLD